MSVTIGISWLEENVSTKVELIRTADVALYTGKASGKNRIITYSQEMDPQKKST
jgi:PleD family two-component response regulator